MERNARAFQEKERDIEEIKVEVWNSRRQEILKQTPLYSFISDWGAHLEIH